MFTSTGLSEATEELERDYTSHKIKDLCKHEGDELHIIGFSKVVPLLSFAWKFDLLTKQVNSSVFDAAWHSCLERASSQKPKLNIADVEHHVWKPAFEHCKKIMTTLKDMSIPLSDVDKYLKTSNEELESELKALSHGVSMCLCKACDDSWIHRSVCKIIEYRKLCAYGKAANLFLKLRDSLKLNKGNFKDVEMIAARVSTLDSCLIND